MAGVVTAGGAPAMEKPLQVVSSAVVRRETGLPATLALNAEGKGATWDLVTLGLLREFRVNGWAAGAFTVALDVSDDGETWRRIKTGTAVSLTGGYSADLTWTPSWRYARGVLIAGVALTSAALHTAAFG